jgi:hypothetical protein
VETQTTRPARNSVAVSRSPPLRTRPSPVPDITRLDSSIPMMRTAPPAPVTTGP